MPPPPPPPMKSGNGGIPLWKLKEEKKLKARLEMSKLTSKLLQLHEDLVIKHTSVMEAFKKTSPAGMLYKTSHYENSLQQYIRELNSVIRALKKKKENTDDPILLSALKETICEIIRQVDLHRLENIKICSIAKSLDAVYSIANDRQQSNEELCLNVSRVFKEALSLLREINKN